METMINHPPLLPSLFSHHRVASSDHAQGGHRLTPALPSDSTLHELSDILRCADRNLGVGPNRSLLWRDFRYYQLQIAPFQAPASIFRASKSGGFLYFLCHTTYARSHCSVENVETPNNPQLHWDFFHKPLCNPWRIHGTMFFHIYLYIRMVVFYG